VNCYQKLRIELNQLQQQKSSTHAAHPPQLKPAEALVLFCAPYLEILLYEKSIQMCRLTMAETSRFPEGAAQYFDVCPRIPEHLPEKDIWALGPGQCGGDAPASRTDSFSAISQGSLRHGQFG
jgi:hypothetical protein